MKQQIHIPLLTSLFSGITARRVDKWQQARADNGYPKGQAPNIAAENAFFRRRVQLALRKNGNKTQTNRTKNVAGQLSIGLQRLDDTVARFFRVVTIPLTPATRTPRAAARGIRSTTRRAGNKAVASSSGDPDSEGEPPPAASLCPLCTAIQRARSLACLVAAHPQHPTTDRFTPSQPAAKSAAGLLSFPQFTQGSFSL